MNNIFIFFPNQANLDRQCSHIVDLYPKDQSLYLQGIFLIVKKCLNVIKYIFKFRISLPRQASGSRRPPQIAQKTLKRPQTTSTDSSKSSGRLSTILEERTIEEDSLKDSLDISEPFLALERRLARSRHRTPPKSSVARSNAMDREKRLKDQFINQLCMMMTRNK